VSSYDLWLFLHVTAVVVWVGGAITGQLFGYLAQKAQDPARSAAFGRDIYLIATRVFLPASIVVLLSGFALQEDGNWDWSEPFLWMGLLLWAVVTVLAFGYVTRQLAATGGRIAAEGQTPELLARLRHLVIFARVLIGVLVVIVFLMVVKPGT
jgi:uncharacterized membrane protein